MLTLDDITAAMDLIQRHTVPAGGQLALTAQDRADRAIDWLQLLRSNGVDREGLQRAVAHCVTTSRWRPEIADIIAALRGPKPTPRGGAAVASEDLATLRRWYTVVAGMGGVVPEWSAVRAAVGDSSRETRARGIFAGDVDRVDRVADAVYRLGGWSALVRAMTGERDNGSDPWRDYGYGWRALYAGDVDGDTGRAEAALARQVDSGRRIGEGPRLQLVDDEAAVRRADDRAMGHIGEVLDAMRAGRR